MRLLVSPHNEWTVLVAAELRAVGADEVCVVATASAQRLWRRVRDSKGIADGAVGADGVDAILAGWGAQPPAELIERYADAARLVVSLRCADRVAVEDPLRWALLNGHDRVEMAIHLADPAFHTLHELDSTSVEVSGLRYGAAATAAAATLWKLLRNADLTTAATAGPIRTVDGPALPLDRDALLIDWSAPAAAVARRVLAGADAPTAAWTYLDGFEVAIGSATVAGGHHHNVAPGTIVRHEHGRATVQTGQGQVRVAGIRDLIGALPESLLRPGLRFGIDPAEECRLLRRRVSDLEQAVQWLLEEWRAQRPPGARTVGVGATEAPGDGDRRAARG